MAKQDVGATRRLEFKRVALERLHLDPSNARTHGPRNMDAIVASLRRFGQAEPLVVHAGTGRIIGGNGRYQAMRQLGWSECDVVEVELDELGATAMGIALNRTAELAEWDGPSLGRLLEQLQAEDAVDGVGYSTDEIDALLAELEHASTGESITQSVLSSSSRQARMTDCHGPH